VFRADELCFAPPDGVGRPNGLVLIANDADSPPNIVFIATDGANAYTVIRRIQFPTATNGIEQCQWNPTTQRFLLNIPEISGPGDDTAPGAVVEINPAFGAFTTVFHTVPIANCAGPQGMAIGPVIAGFSTVLLGCNAPSVPSGVSNSVIVLGSNPSVVLAQLTGQGGADQVWFDPIAIHYFITGGSLLPAQTFGITDALTGLQDQNIFIGLTGATTRRSHSTASWSGSGLGSTVTAAFVPVSATGGSTTAPFSSTVCGAQAAQGCIAVFGTVPIPTSDTADLD
jgi:hypothetical protein